MALRVTKLDKLLRMAFQEQAEKIVPPSSQQLWAELKQRPEFAKLEEMKEKWAALQLPKERERRHEGKGDAIFGRKRRYMVGFAAACFMLVVIFIKFVPLSRGVESFMDDLLAFSGGKKAEISMQGGDSAEISAAPGAEAEKETELPLKSFPLSSNREKALSQRSASQPLQEQGQENEFQAALSLEEDKLQQDYSVSAQELRFEEERAFYLALEEISHLAPEGIWRVKGAPDDFHFQEGTIVKTDKSLLSVHQEFKTGEGHTLSLVQQFLQEDGATASVAIAAEGLEQPIQVGPYFGHLWRHRPGALTLTWQQEGSIVTLSGELEEEQLYQILASLED